MPSTRPSVMVIIAASLWGTTGTVAYFLGDLSPVAIGAVTMGFGGLVLAWLARHELRAVLGDAQARRWALTGGAAVAVYPLAFYSGMNFAGVAVGNIVALGTGPLIGATLEWAIRKQRLSIGWGLATSIGVLGLIAISSSDHEQTTADSDLFGLGVALALVAGIAYGIFSYSLGHIAQLGYSARASSGATFGIGAIPLLIVALLYVPSLTSSLESWPGLAYLIAGPMVISYVLFSRALTSLRSSTVLTIALVEPAVATLLAIGVVGERFDAAGLLGVALVMVSVIVAARTSRVHRSS